MSKFQQLPSTPVFDGVQHKVFYPNDYGASIVKHQYSYGGSLGKWELAVLKGTEKKWDLCYNTPITNDVLGYLSEQEVDSILQEIENLPSSH
jgi:hypothetical protein